MSEDYRGSGNIDLHIHTTASDGTFSPQEIVSYAKSKGLRAIAITDHDTVDGVPLAMAAGEELNFKVIQGVEISVDHDNTEMHLLGYFKNPDLTFLNKKLQELQDFRRERNPKIIKKFLEHGIYISLAEVEKEAGGKVIGRPHFASLLVKKGYVRDKQEAFDKFLANGKLAYVKKEKLIPQEGIELILQAGGLPVLAHPKYLKEQGYAQLDVLLAQLVNMGLRGIEAYYTTHDSEDTSAYLQLAAKYDLLVTGGTDFHGANKPEIDLGVGTGDLHVPYRLMENLEKAWGDGDEFKV